MKKSGTRKYDVIIYKNKKLDGVKYSGLTLEESLELMESKDLHSVAVTEDGFGYLVEFSKEELKELL